MMQKMHPDPKKLLCAVMTLREKSGVQARFLLGPAGSGKTFRCLAEIRAALQQDAQGLSAAPEQREGRPLILLAPKQATFQLERQLLTDRGLFGYTRLHIFSFDRLARFILEKQLLEPPDQLDDQGRVMVLRALIMQLEEHLRLFRPSVRRPGFAQQLSRLLSELQQHQFTPAKLRALAARFPERGALPDKLHDLALLLDAYTHWLARHELQDADCLLNLATDTLQSDFRLQASDFRISGLWLDGFAEMTPQELDLLTALLPHCRDATLAFCLEPAPESTAKQSWLSVSSAVAKTYQQCRQRLDRSADCKITVEVLKRDPKKNRFAGNSALRYLEQNWSQPPRNSGTARPSPSAISLIRCLHPDAEAVFAARVILRFVRGGGRFRDTAVLVRDLDVYHKPLARVFRRYQIPFFLDRRESVTHHPLAELTRSALRTVSFNWAHDDWFAVLKAGFSAADPAEIDQLENAALEYGWRGTKWREPIQIVDNLRRAKSLEKLRQKIIPPFEKFAARLTRLKNQPTGPQLADEVRDLWDALQVQTTLEHWSHVESQQSAIHLTVWEQMNAWLDNVALAFPDESLSLREWLPILEAGLMGLTVGVVPPALDQVLIGAVDRARNPDLRLVLALGANEGIFPEAPAAPPILTHADRDELEQHQVVLGPNLRDQLARERYLGYIACTRASEKLFVSFSRQDAGGRTMNPSSLVVHLQALFPELRIAEFDPHVDWRNAEQVTELVAPLVPLLNIEAGQAVPSPPRRRGDIAPDRQNWADLLQFPSLKKLAESLCQLREPDPAENLSPVLAEAVYGPVLLSSVSRLEEFAQCPFRFFVHSGLRAEERKVFELDARERGSFQHEVLKQFHEQLSGEGRRWRDLTPKEARARIGQITANLAPGYRDGLLRTDDQGRFTARVLGGLLQDFVETVVTWMHGQYEFDPAAAELEFGSGAGAAPAWELDLGDNHKLVLRGRIDRLDLCRETGKRMWCVVVDYKSGQRKLDPVLVEHGVQLQLVGYLAAARRWFQPAALPGVERLVPAGVFYVNLRGKYDGGNTRTEALNDADESRRRAYRHTGRFSVDALPKLDNRPDVKSGDQFNYRRNQDGSLNKGSVEALPREEFEALLDRVESQLTEMGRAIFSGLAAVDPYRKGSETPCRFCDYRPVCRIDPWTHRYRGLRAAPREVDA